MKYRFDFTTRFKKEYRRLSADKINDVDKVIQILLNGETLPEKYRDHKLTGNKKSFCDCHVRPDLVLIYKIEEDILLLTAVEIGSHSNLF